MAGRDELLARVWEHVASMDAAVATVRRAPWGAIVTDPSSPQVWDVNYARVEVSDPGLRLPAVEALARPALAAVEARRLHVVLQRPETTLDLLTDLSTRGDAVRWEAIMSAATETSPATADHDERDIVELDQDGPEFGAVQRSQDLAFGVDDDEVSERLRVIEERMRPLGKRFFGILDPAGPGGFAAIAAIVPGDGIAYIDNVVTFPHARRRGHASALVRHLLGRAAVGGAQHVYLLVDANGPAALYARLGFDELTRIASTLGPERYQPSSGGGT
ncbi:MAG: GNAT family N-acetyltransferase [Actinomycetota bacterium]